MIAALFIYNPKGDVIMSKLYSDGVRRNISDIFRIQVLSVNSQHYSGSGGGREIRSPVLTLGSTSFIYIKSGSLWICAVTRSNQDCSAILEFLYKLESLLKVIVFDTPANIPLNEDILVSNFNVVYELLDEVIEFGYPTNLELNYLKNFMTTISKDRMFKMPNKTLTSTTSSNGGIFTSRNDSSKLNSSTITWRNSGIKYRRNEIFLNVEEKINVLMNSQAEVLRASVDGIINMKTHLSGMPECRFGLNDDSLVLNSMSADRTAVPDSGSVTLEDCKFHQCVELNKFDSDRVIQFIPPDGGFQLMSYNCLSNINVPFEVYPQVHELGNSRLSYKLRIKSLYPAKIPATGVQIKIPTPKGVLKSYMSSSSGKSKFHPEENYIIWKFNKFLGNQEHDLTAEVELTDSGNTGEIKNLLNWNRPPIKLEFTLDMFSCSGLTVKYLKVQEKSSYRTVKWVKYTSQSGSYDIRY